jgi:hypothetical protein
MKNENNVASNLNLLDYLISCLETENMAVGISHADHMTPSIRKSLH